MNTDAYLELLRALREENTSDHAEIKALLIAQNGRIRTLEQWRAYLIGIAAGVSGLVTAIVMVIARALG